MKFENLINNTKSLETILLHIYNNDNFSYEWHSLKNNKNCYLELGGRNKNNILELKAYIPKFENNKYITHPNGMIKSEYSIELNGEMNYSDFRVHTHIIGLEKFLNFIKNTNFKKYKPTIEEKQIIEYSSSYVFVK